MTGATSSESSDAEHPRPLTRSLRPRRSPGMRRRHHIADAAESVVCRPHTCARQGAGSHGVQQTRSVVLAPVSLQLPQVCPLEIRNTSTCSAPSEIALSNHQTSYRGAPLVQPSSRSHSQVFRGSHLPTTNSSQCLTTARAHATSIVTASCAASIVTASCVVSRPTQSSSTGLSRPLMRNAASITSTRQFLTATSVSPHPTCSLTSSSHRVPVSIGLSTSSSVPSTSLSSQEVSTTEPLIHPQQDPVSLTSQTTMPGTRLGPRATAAPTALSSGTSSISTGLERQILEETITAVKVPMMRPNPFLLQVIRAAGGIGDVFTMGQIIHHVKNYIGQRVMYDQQNPGITHCDGDLLGRALGVKQFTIFEAIGLFERNCTPVQDSCIRMRRHVEVRPSPGSNSETGRNSEDVGSYPSPAGLELPTSTVADSERYREHVSMPDSSSSCQSQQTTSGEIISSCNPSPARSEYTQVTGMTTPLASQETATPATEDSRLTTSTTASQESSYFSQTEISSSLESQDIGPSASQTAIRDLSQHSPLSQPSSSFSSSASSTSAVVNFKAVGSSVTLSDRDLRTTQPEQQYSTDSSSDGGKEAGMLKLKDLPTRGRGMSPRRGPGTSINVRLDEPDGDVGQWECRVRVHTSGSDPVGDEDGNADYETVVLEYQSDHFSVEYELATSSDDDEEEQSREQGPEVKSGSNRARSVSEASSLSSGLGTGTAMLVVYKESDVEYLADYSDTDTGSDAELSEGDKWSCPYCNVKNPPFQRNCGGCWSVRSDWLPSLPSTDSQRAPAPVGGPSKIVEGGDKQKSENEKVTETVGQGQHIPQGQDKNSCADATAPPDNSMAGCSGSISKRITAASNAMPVADSSAASCKVAGNVAVTSSSDDCPKLFSGAVGLAGTESFLDCKQENKTGTAVCPDTDVKTLKAEAFKAMAAALKQRAKKRQYSSGFSTSDSQDDCPKSKCKPPPVRDGKSKKSTETESSVTAVKSGAVREQSLGRPGKQRPSFYSERTLGALSRNEACVVCLTRPKTASIIHGKTGHQVCCYHCAKKLKKQRRACPICRRPIQKVIRNYHL